MERVSHQAIVLQFILELAKSLKIDPRGCFRQFFIKFAQNENPDYNTAFMDELKSFRGRVKERAEARIQAFLEEQEKEEKEKRIEDSPGGLGLGVKSAFVYLFHHFLLLFTKFYKFRNPYIKIHKRCLNHYRNRGKNVSKHVTYLCSNL